MRFFLLAIAALFAGCASQVAKLTTDLENHMSCCTALAELPFDPLAAEKEIRFTIGSGDRVFGFPSGKSYVKAFELPKEGRFTGLEVRTYLMGEWIPAAHVFGPFLQFLDAARMPLGGSIFPQLYYDTGFIEGARWTGVVKVPDSAKYVVLYTKPELAKYQRIPLASTSGYGYMAGGTFVYVPPSGERSSAYGPSGELRVRLIR